jgi:hypothetical protein
MVVSPDLLFSQIASLAIILAALFFLVRSSQKDKNYLIYAVPMYVWLAISTVWYSVIIYDQATPDALCTNQTYLNWGAAIRLMGYVVIFILALSRWFYEHGKRGESGR